MRSRSSRSRLAQVFRPSFAAAKEAAEDAAFDRRMLLIEKLDPHVVGLAVVGIVDAAAPLLTIRLQTSENRQPDERARTFRLVAIVDKRFSQQAWAASRWGSLEMRGCRFRSQAVARQTAGATRSTTRLRHTSGGAKERRTALNAVLQRRGASGICRTVRIVKRAWRCGREAEGGGLLNRYRVVKPYRGFESLRLRQFRVTGAKGRARRFL